LHQTQSCCLLIPSGHVPAKCRRILSLRTVLAVIVDLPEAIYILVLQINLPQSFMQGILQPHQAFLQSSATTLPDPVLPAKRDPALAAVSQYYYYSCVPAGEVIADMLSYPVPGLEKAIKHSCAQSPQSHKCLHPVRLTQNAVDHLFYAKSFEMLGDFHLFSSEMSCPGKKSLIAVLMQREVVEEVFRNLQVCHISSVVSLQPLIFRNGAALLIRTPIAASSALATIGCLLR
jgi:hypothetical protein